jgi:murein DD-endopeptidase MepM/ murein hydrolase activator NlpD
MASVHDYKRLENNIVLGIKNVVVAGCHGIAGVFKAVGGFLTRRYTVVFVPHSEKKVYNLHINIISVFLFLLVAGGITGVVIRYGASYNSTQTVLAGKDSHFKDMQASLDQLRDETAVLLREARTFESAFSNALSSMSPDFNTQQPQASGGDLSSFFNIRETPEGMLQEVDDVRRISSYLAAASDNVEAIVDKFTFENSLLAEIPSIWPVKSGLGHITMYFGQNIHPFSGQYYIHRGIDISTFRAGDAVVVTADGQVVTVDYSDDFGNYIIVKHKYGYYTRYAHLLYSRVRLGQQIQQGDVIGYIGSTGISTGPHLHYEIHIGSDVVDPYKYMNIRSGINKQGR